jgi:hypothetical protein
MNLGQPAIGSLPNGGRVFAGNRDEYFYIDLGVFDALNLRSTTSESGGIDSTKGYNVSTIAIEVPVQELTRSGAVPAGPTAADAVIGVWATASRKSVRVLGPGNSDDQGRGRQVSGPNYTTFLSDGTPHEYLRLNVAIPITPIGSQNRLGLLGGDFAGFPNGRRVFDDVTDIALRAVAGGTPFTPATNQAPNNQLGDGVSFNPEGPLLTRFPYLLPPNQGNQPRTSNQQ